MPAQTQLHTTIMDIRLSISVSPPRIQSSSLPGSLPVESSSPPISMPLPLEAIYSSREELYTLIQAWAAQHYYAFRIGRSNKINKGTRLKIFYDCDRCGAPPQETHPQKYPHSRIRNTSTRKTNCQFLIVAIQHIDTA